MSRKSKAAKRCTHSSCNGTVTAVIFGLFFIPDGVSTNFPPRVEAPPYRTSSRCVGACIIKWPFGTKSDAPTGMATPCHVLLQFYYISQYAVSAVCLQQSSHITALTNMSNTSSGNLADMVGLWKVQGFVDPKTRARVSHSTLPDSLKTGIIKRNEVLRLCNTDVPNVVFGKYAQDIATFWVVHYKRRNKVAIRAKGELHTGSGEI